MKKTIEIDKSDLITAIVAGFRWIGYADWHIAVRIADGAVAVQHNTSLAGWLSLRDQGYDGASILTEEDVADYADTEADLMVEFFEDEEFEITFRQ
jgi:hypothetical protein